MTDKERDIKSRTRIETTKPHKNLEDKNAMELIEYNDGAISLSDDEKDVDCWEMQMIYLYPEQVEQLTNKLIERRNKEHREKLYHLKECKNETEED